MPMPMETDLYEYACLCACLFLCFISLFVHLLPLSIWRRIIKLTLLPLIRVFPPIFFQCLTIQFGMSLANQLKYYFLLQCS